MRKIFIFLFALVLVCAPLCATYAYTAGGGIVPNCNTGPLNAQGEYVNKCDFNQLINLVNSIIDFLLFYIASPIAAIIFVYAGFKLLTSGGSSEAMTSAKKMMGNMIKGYIIALAAWLIIHTIAVSILNFQGETFLKK
jgi:hypothetical protein